MFNSPLYFFYFIKFNKHKLIDIAANLEHLKNNTLNILNKKLVIVGFRYAPETLP